MSQNAIGGAGPNAAMIEEKVIAIVQKKAPMPVSIDDDLDSVGLDSLAMAELVFEIESSFSIRTDDRLLEMKTLRDVVTYVQEVAAR